jgi:Raf kinase inhibitor-like YbhB/YbcL family protein
MKKLYLQIRFLFLILVLICTGCGTKSTPSPTEVPTKIPTATPVPAEESALSPATPAEPTIAPPTKIPPTEESLATEEIPFELTSMEFNYEEPIPIKFSCDGANISPPLQWGDPPEGTLSFALIFDDPDAPAGIWVHWVLYNIPAEARALSEAIPSEAELPDGSRHGLNSFGRMDYGGPCPPGGPHRYFFKLYALDVMLDLEPGADKEILLQAMEGHILAQAELMGTYAR